MKHEPRLVVVSDVDGGLIDQENHAHADAAEALERLRKAGIPLVLCSSRTRAELERSRERLQLADPFISENGGAVFVPADTFPFQPAGSVRRGAYDVVELGRPHRQVLNLLLSTAARVGAEITTFSDMSIQRVAAECRLSLADARLAKLREYDEPFQLVEPDPEARERLRRSLRSAGLRWTNGGRFDHVTVATDQGVAIALLRRFYLRAWGEVTVAGLGDAENDLDLLRAVDIPIVVRGADAAATTSLLTQVRRAQVTRLQGPAGWNEAVLSLLDDAGQAKPAKAGLFTSRGSRGTAARTAR